MFSEIIFLYLIAAQTECFKVEVKVQEGTVIGTTEETMFEGRLYAVFYAVPYAASPIGKHRFKDPLPMAKWKMQRDCTSEYFGTCAQHHITQRNAVFGFEDCLRLNIYTPYTELHRQSILKPVLVWVHGFAFTTSFSHIYLPDHFIDNDILFVSISHRIGAFGFLKLNESDSNANMGLKDIQIGLKWIRKNIHKFGGDKNQITLMASGSAGTFASMLLLTKARKLFSKLIILSAGISSPSLFHDDQNTELFKLSKELKKLTIENVTKASTENIITASDRIYKRKDLFNAQRPVIPFTPIVEKKSNQSLLTRRPSKSALKKVNIPILIGFNAQEGLTEVIPFLSNPNNMKILEKSFKYFVPFPSGCHHDMKAQTYKRVAHKLIRSYMKEDFSEKSVQRILKYASDIQKYPIYKFIKALVEHKKTVYVYKFNYNGMFNAFKNSAISESKLNVSGAASGDELCYIFRCNPIIEGYHPLVTNMTHPERIFIKKIATAFSNFVKTGDPTPDTFHDFKWPPMTSEYNQLLLFKKKEIKMTYPHAEEKMLKFWNKIYDEHYAPEHCVKIKHEEL